MNTNTMTLEQVSEKLKSHADFMGSHGGAGTMMNSVELSECIDSIDAHLAAQEAKNGEQVGREPVIRMHVTSNDGLLWYNFDREGCTSELKVGTHLLFANPKPEQAVGDGVVGYMTVHEDHEMVNNWAIHRLKYDVVAKMPPGEYLLYTTPRPAVATPAKRNYTELNREFSNGFEAGKAVATPADVEVTDDVRVPLHEVWADVDYLIARVEQGTISRSEVVSVIRRKIDNAYAALTAQSQASKDIPENEIDRYQDLCAAVYQAAGVYDLPVRFLDALSDAATGEIELRQQTSKLLPCESPSAGAVVLSEWTDEQCAEFMCVAFRHVEYKRNGHSPTCDDIRLGVKSAIAAAPEVLRGN